MTHYAVIAGQYEDIHIVTICSDEERANKIAKIYGGWVEPYNEEDCFVPEKSIYTVTAPTYRPEEIECEYEELLSEEDAYDIEEDEHPYCNGRFYFARIWAEDSDEAKKIFTDQLRKYLKEKINNETDKK